MEALHEAVGVLLHEDPEISDRNVRTSIAPCSPCGPLGRSLVMAAVRVAAGLHFLSAALEQMDVTVQLVARAHARAPSARTRRHSLRRVVGQGDARARVSF